MRRSRLAMQIRENGFLQPKQKRPSLHLADHVSCDQRAFGLESEQKMNMVLDAADTEWYAVELLDNPAEVSACISGRQPSSIIGARLPVENTTWYWMLV